MGKSDPQRKDSSSSGANFFRTTWRLSGPHIFGIRGISGFVRRDSKAEKVPDQGLNCNERKSAQVKAGSPKRSAVSNPVSELLIFLIAAQDPTLVFSI